MKNIALILLCSICSMAYGQNEELELPKTIFKIVPQHFFVNTMTLGIENFNFNSTRSLTVMAGISTASGFYNYDGAGGELQYRKYVKPFEPYQSKRGNEFLISVYVGGFVTGGYYKGFEDRFDTVYDSIAQTFVSRNIKTEHTVASVFPGFIIGFQRTFVEILFMDIYAGGGIKFTKVTFPDGVVEDEDLFDITDRGYQGVMPRIGFTFGIKL